MRKDFTDYKNELTAPIKSIRIFAIERAIRSPASHELLSILKSSLELESDPECLLLLRHAISQTETILANVKFEYATEDEIEQKFPHSSAEEQLRLLYSIRAGHLSGSKGEKLIRTLLPSSLNPGVTAMIVKKFGRFWPADCLNVLEANLYSDTKSLQIACIKTMAAMFPDNLKNELPKLLRIEDPSIRSLVIRIMSRHFPNLAAEFISDCFEKGGYYDRLTALQACATMQFQLVKQSLLNLIFTDADPKIFRMAFTILLSNPDREIPFRLVAIICNTTKEKAKFLKSYLPAYCKNLKISGICKDFDAYLNMLKNFSRQMNAKIFVYRHLAFYVSENTDESLSHIKNHLDDDYVISTMRDYISTCRDEALNHTLTKLISKETVQCEPQSAMTERKSVPLHDSSELLLKEFDTVKFRKNPATIEKVRNVLANEKAPDDLRFAAFKVALRCNIKGYTAIAKHFLESNNETHIACGLKYLVKFDPDSFHTAIQAFIDTESFTIRNTLIYSTSKAAPEYAKFLIKRMLDSKDREKRLHGLESTFCMDFSYICPILLNFLEKEEDSRLFESGIKIFLANPKPESAYHFTILKKARPQFKEILENAEIRLREILCDMKIASPEEIDFMIETRQREAAERTTVTEQEKELAELKKTVKWNTLHRSNDTKKSVERLSETIADFLGEFFKSCSMNYNLHMIAVIMIAFGLSAFIFLYGVNPGHEYADSDSSKVMAGKLPQRTPILPEKGSNISLKLIGFDSKTRSWISEGDQKRIYRILPNPTVDYRINECINIKVGKARYSVTGQIVIYPESVQ